MWLLLVDFSLVSTLIGLAFLLFLSLEAGEGKGFRDMES